MLPPANLPANSMLQSLPVPMQAVSKWWTWSALQLCRTEGLRNLSSMASQLAGPADRFLVIDAGHSQYLAARSSIVQALSLKAAPVSVERPLTIQNTLHQHEVALHLTLTTLLLLNASLQIMSCLSIPALKAARPDSLDHSMLLGSVSLIWVRRALLSS